MLFKFNNKNCVIALIHKLFMGMLWIKYVISVLVLAMVHGKHPFIDKDFIWFTDHHHHLESSASIKSSQGHDCE